MDTNLPGSGSEPEYLGDGPSATPGHDEHTDDGTSGDGPGTGPRRRTAVLAATGVAVAAVVGVGGWGLAQFLSGGDSAASALPAGTAAYLTMDLDPSGVQKIEALRTLRSFPGIKKHLDLGVRDDIRRYVVDKIAEDCKGLDYDKDVKPWIGSKLAVAAVPMEGKAVQVVALEDSDEDAGRATVAKLNACDDATGSSKPAGVAYVNGFLLVSDTQAHADAVAKQTAKGTLADDAAFQTWMDRAGDSGVITAYASKAAPDLVKDLVDDSALSRTPGLSSQKGMLDKAFGAYKNFQGAAMVVRFGSGSVETEVVAKGVDQAVTPTAAPSVADLPATTALAMSVGLQEGWLKNYLAQMNDVMGGGTSLDDALKQGEAATGLQLPEDIETMLGKGVTISVDGNVDMKSLASAPDPSKLPVAIRVTGDPATVTPVVEKLKKLAGPDAGMVAVQSGDGVVLVGVDPAYLETLSAKGGLGSTRAFQEAVPHASGAAGVFFVNFDAGDWAAKLGDLISDNNPDVRANLEPLQALGMSSWLDKDQVAHVQLKLTTN